MRRSEQIMGMVVTMGVPGAPASEIQPIFDYFQQIDQRFSPFKQSSEVSAINRGDLDSNQYSTEMQEVLKLSEQTKHASGGYFDVYHDSKFDPSGLVKGWAIHHAADLLRQNGWTNFYVEAGGDIEVSGYGKDNLPWKIGLRHPFKIDQVMQVINLTNAGVATSGTYLLGQHIYNPHRPNRPITDVVSLTVIGPNVYEADRFATAAFAMGEQGINFIEEQPGLDGYLINHAGVATSTSGFARYTDA